MSNTLSQPPKPASPVSVEERLRQARQRFEEKFKVYHELLKDKKVEINKSPGDIQQEKFIMDELVKACVNLDQFNVGEGVLALASVALREHIKMRDRINELEYKMDVFMREVTRIVGKLERKADVEK